MLHKIDKQLITLTLICFTLVSVRVGITQSGLFLFLVWNLFLAGIPYLITKLTEKVKHLTKLKLLFIAMGWLAFFPNAPYIITDFIHLRVSPSAIFWFDLCLITTFSFTGLAYGIYSLYSIKQLIAKTYSPRISFLFIGISIVLSGFGMYLGRVLRWNSWDIMTNPLELLRDVSSILLNPIQNKEVFITSLSFAIVITVAYILLKPKTIKELI